jgi:hypothetical protein
MTVTLPSKESFTGNVTQGQAKEAYDQLVDFIGQSLPADGTPVQASAIANTPNGNVTSTTVQDAINEVDSRIGANPSYRNLLINGNFLFRQWSTWGGITSYPINSGSAYGYFDRWVLAGVGSTLNTTHQTFAYGQPEIPDDPFNYGRFTVTSVNGVNNYASIAQRVEFAEQYSSSTLTYSFWAKADAPKDIAIEFMQIFGTGGSSSVYGIGSTKFHLTTTWTKYTSTVNLPSVAGKTIGIGSAVGMLVWFDAGSNFSSRTASLGQQSGIFDMTQIQLERGAVATPFENLPVPLQYQLCQRYCETGISYGISYGISTTEAQRVITPYKMTKRIVPSVGIAQIGGAGSSPGLTLNDSGMFVVGYTSVGSSVEMIFKWLSNAEL